MTKTFKKYRKQIIVEDSGEILKEAKIELPSSIKLHSKSKFVMKMEECSKLNIRLAGVFDRICMEFLHFESIILLKKDHKGNKSRPRSRDFRNVLGLGESMTRKYLKKLVQEKALIRIGANRFMVNPNFAMVGKNIPLEEAVILFHNNQGFLKMISKQDKENLEMYIKSNGLYLNPSR